MLSVENPPPTSQPGSEDPLKARILKELLTKAEKQEEVEERIAANTARQAQREEALTTSLRQTVRQPPFAQPPRFPFPGMPLTPSQPWVDESPFWGVLLGSMLLLTSFLTQQAWPIIIFIILSILLTLKGLRKEGIIFIILLTLYLLTLTNPAYTTLYLGFAAASIIFIILTSRPSQRVSGMLIAGFLISLIAGVQSSILQGIIPHTLLGPAKAFILYPAVLYAFILASHEPDTPIRIPHFITASIILAIILASIAGMLGTAKSLPAMHDILQTSIDQAPSLQDTTPARSALAKSLYTLFSGTWLQEWFSSIILTATGQEADTPDQTVYGTHIGIPPALLYPARLRTDGLLPGQPSPVTIEAHVQPTIPTDAVRAICSATEEPLKGMCDEKAVFTAAYTDDPSPVTVTPKEETLRALFYSQDYPLTLQPSVPHHLGMHTIQLNISYPFATTTYAAFILGDTRRIDTARLQQVRQRELSGRELISFGGPVIISATKPGVITLDEKTQAIERPFIISIQPMQQAILTSLETVHVTLPQGFTLKPLTQNSILPCDFTPVKGKANTYALSAHALEQINTLILPTTDPVRISCKLQSSREDAERLIDPATGIGRQSITLTSTYNLTSTSTTQLEAYGTLDLMLSGMRGGKTYYSELNTTTRALLAQSCDHPLACLVLTDDQMEKLNQSEEAFVQLAEQLYPLKEQARVIAQAAFDYCLPHGINPAYPLAIITAENGWNPSHFSWTCNNPYDIKYFALSFPTRDGDGKQEACGKRATDGGGFARYESLREATAHVCAILTHYAKRGQTTPERMNDQSYGYAYANGGAGWSSNVRASLLKWDGTAYAKILTGEEVT